MKHHPYTAIWPLIDSVDFEKLRADIQAHGQRLPILTYQNQVLDGRNRERACEELGIAPQYDQAPVKTDDEAINLIVSLNMHRRHLTPAQRAVAGERLATLRHGRPGKNRPGDPFINKSLAQAAAEVGASYGSVKRVRAIRTHGTDADIADILSGKAAMKAKCEAVQPKRMSKTAPPTRTQRPSGGGRVLRLHNTPPMKTLTREQIDPEFKGTPMDWVDKYGHVQTHTAEQYATMRFGDWMCHARALAKRWRELPELRDVDHNWLRSPGQHDLKSLTESLEFLRPKIAELEALLACATAAMAKKKQTAA
jgi:hypothetical protein